MLDPVLQGYVEGDRTAADLVADGFDPAVVDLVVRLVDGAEYKRRQMPPGVRITTKAFGKDRRMPITNRYRPAAPTEPTEPEPARPARPCLSSPLAAGRHLARRSTSSAAAASGGTAGGEHRLFELTGRWASGTGDPEIRVLFERDVGPPWHASRSSGGTGSPSGPGSTSPPSSWPRAGPMPTPSPSWTGQSDDLLRLGGLTEVVLPRLALGLSGRTWRRPLPVSEGPVIEVLRQIAAAEDREWATGQALLRPDQSARLRGRRRSGRPTPQRAGKCGRILPHP